MNHHLFIHPAFDLNYKSEFNIDEIILPDDQYLCNDLPPTNNSKPQSPPRNSGIIIIEEEEEENINAFS